MKEGIHPDFHPEAKAICACGNSWTVGSTVPVIRTDVCSKCHPFFTGEQRIVDAGGQVERFLKKLKRREQKMEEAESRKAERTSPGLSITELGLSTRVENVLLDASIQTVGDILVRLEAGGDEAMMNVKGFGLKSLVTLKKLLRSQDFVLPGDAVLAAAE